MTLGQEVDVAAIALCLSWLAVPAWLGWARVPVAALVALGFWFLVMSLALGSSKDAR